MLLYLYFRHDDEHEEVLKFGSCEALQEKILIIKFSRRQENANYILWSTAAGVFYYTVQEIGR